MDATILLLIMNNLYFALLNAANTFAFHKERKNDEVDININNPGTFHRKFRSLTLPPNLQVGPTPSHPTQPPHLASISRRSSLDGVLNEEQLLASLDDMELARPSSRSQELQHSSRRRSTSFPAERVSHQSASTDPTAIKLNASRFPHTFDDIVSSNAHQPPSPRGHGEVRSRALSNATYGQRSVHRRMKTLGTDFMSEEEHLRFVSKRVRLLEGNKNATLIEQYASEEAQLSAIREAVLLLADLYVFRSDETPDSISSEDINLRYSGRFARCLSPSVLPKVACFVLAMCISAAIAAMTLNFEGIGEVMVALSVAPVGALLRYRLGLENARHKQFPIFTLLANLGGCAVTAAMHAIITTKGGHAAPICSALATGFAGSLSTVSTLYAEARVLNNPRNMVKYLGATHLASQILLFCVNYPISLQLRQGTDND